MCLDGIINETDFSCTVNKTVVVTTSFPFEEFEEYYITECQGEITWENSSNSFDHMIRRSAVYFAVCGPLTMFYCIIAVLVYMLVTANEQWGKVFDYLTVLVNTWLQTDICTYIAIHLLLSYCKTMQPIIYRFVILQDIALHVSWIVCWLIASVMWAVMLNRMRLRVNYILMARQFRVCIEEGNEPLEDRNSYVQAHFAVVSYTIVDMHVW